MILTTMKTDKGKGDRNRGRSSENSACALTEVLPEPEAISKQAINAVMPDLFRHLSMKGRDPDLNQSGRMTPDILR